jgi:hypothetical protein
MFTGKRRKHILGDQEHGFGTVSFSHLEFVEAFNYNDPPEMDLDFEEGFED